MRKDISYQKYPSSIIRVGVVLYSYDAFSFDDGSSTVELQEWCVRSIQRRRGSQTKRGHKRIFADYHQDKHVNITQKIKDITWGKRSKKSGDYGFLNSIPSNCRKQFKD